MPRRLHIRAKSFSARLPLKFLYVSRSLFISSTMEVVGAVSVSPAWVFRIKRWTEISKTYEMPTKYVCIGRPRELSSAQRENLEKMRDAKAMYQE